ncbi:hypothetical protein LSAT2_015414 [Lamellibrachia satsuma]|nr:hypothetical protein LSAT2_015414 [Lamellibrachia satsuma]
MKSSLQLHWMKVQDIETLTGRERQVAGSMAFYRYYDTLGSDLDLFGVNDITMSYSYKPRRLPVLSAGGAYSGSSSYYSPIGSMIHTTLGQRRYGSYNSLGYQDSNYASLGSRYRSYGRGCSGYGSAGLSRRYLDLDSYDLASTYPSKSFPAARSLFV